MCVCVCACVRACVHAYVRVCVVGELHSDTVTPWGTHLLLVHCVYPMLEPVSC